MSHMRKSYRKRIVLLKGGPYDGQDIPVTNEEWAQGVLIRLGQWYVSQVPNPATAEVRSGSEVFTWVVPEARSGTAGGSEAGPGN